MKCHGSVQRQPGRIFDRLGLSHNRKRRALLQPPTNAPTKYQLPTPYGFQDKARTRFSNLRSLQQGQTKVTP